ncbi:LysR family transcriptional regulator [Streptomyces pactum]|uniref:LysR family transcriptional regulator n=1 Tax=Streptomyces pactum TaxID=68249 RepID=UPI0036F7FD88
MDIEIADLRLLKAVAETGSLAGAARRLGTHQGTLSRRLKRIERTTGVVVFRRGHEGATPTAAGRVLLRGADAILPLVDRLVEAAATDPAPDLRDGSEDRPEVVGADDQEVAPGTAGAHGPGRNGPEAPPGGPVAGMRPGPPDAPARAPGPTAHGQPEHHPERARPGRPVRAGEAEPSVAPVRYGDPERLGDPEPADVPVRGGTPDRAGHPVRPAQPVRDGAPVRPAGPLREGKPVRPSDPVGVGAPVRPAEPVWEEGPVREGGPVGDGGPARAGEPVGERTADRARTASKDPVRVGAVPNAVLPLIAGHLGSLLPGTPIALSTADSGTALLDLVRAHRLDLAVLRHRMGIDAPPPDGVQTLAVAEERLLVGVAERHRLAGRRRLTLADLGAETCVLHGPRHGALGRHFLDAVERAAAGGEGRPGLRWAADGAEAAALACALDAVLPCYPCPAPVPGITYLPLDDPAARFQLVLAWPTDGRLAAYAPRLAEHARRAYPGGGAAGPGPAGTPSAIP